MGTVGSSSRPAATPRISPRTGITERPPKASSSWHVLLCRDLSVEQNGRAASRKRHLVPLLDGGADAVARGEQRHPLGCGRPREVGLEAVLLPDDQDLVRSADAHE